MVLIAFIKGKETCCRFRGFENTSDPPALAGCHPLDCHLRARANAGDSDKQLGGDKRRDINIVFPYFAVESRAIDTEQVSGCLLVAAGALKRLLDYQPLDIFQSHVGRHIPSCSRR